MREDELWNLLAQREGEAIEYKTGIITRREIAEYAVGIGNAGGGWLIMGVSDKMPRRILSIEAPLASDLAKIRASVADAAQIHVSIEVIHTTKGPVLVVRIPGRPRGTLFHTRDGKYLIRLGDELRGMTLSEIDAIRKEAGIEFTAGLVPGNGMDYISATGMEELRRLMKEAAASEDLLRQADRDLLRSLGLLTDGGRLRIAGLLLAGKPESIREHIPYAEWKFFRMKTDTEYEQAESGHECLPIALRRMRELVAGHNPIVTIPGWLIHPEFPRYPVMALRELIVNALVHRDYNVPGAMIVKLYPDRLEISNPGDFVNGVTPQNILHHPSTPRYPILFNALARIRLANAANLGVPRIYRELLSEGKEPPIYWRSRNAVRVIVTGQVARREFLNLVRRYPGLDVDHLLLLHYLTRHREITARETAELCQRPIEVAREVLSQLVTQWNLLETGGAGRGRYYRLSRIAYDLLVGTLSYYVDRRLAIENAKVRILAALAERSLTNAEVREVTQMSRNQALWLLKGLQKEGFITLEGRGRGSRWSIERRES